MGWCRPSAVLLVRYYLLLYVPSYKNSTIDGLSQCSYIPYPLDGVIDAPLLWRTFSHTLIWGHHFDEQGLHVRPYFGAKTHFRQTFCTNHQFLLNCDNFQYLSLAVMATNNPEAEEVSRVNKLLQIEDLAWTRQLEKAVSV